MIFGDGVTKIGTLKEKIGGWVGREGECDVKRGRIRIMKCNQMGEKEWNKIFGDGEGKRLEL